MINSIVSDDLGHLGLGIFLDMTTEFTEDGGEP